MIKKCIFIISCFSSLIASAQTDPLIVGTNAEFPPFCLIENREIVGFDIDIAKAVAEKLERSIVFKDMPFDALIPDLVLGRVDFVAAGMSYTEERAKRVLFTKSYITSDPLVIFTKAGLNLNIDTLIGKTVVVIEGFTADALMTDKKGVKLVRLTTQADGFMAIKSGRADAFITAKSTVESFFATQDASQFHYNLIEGTGESCVLAIPKSKNDLFVEIQKALDALENEGTLAHIKAKWKLQ